MRIRIIGYRRILIRWVRIDLSKNDYKKDATALTEAFVSLKKITHLIRTGNDCIPVSQTHTNANLSDTGFIIRNIYTF